MATDHAASVVAEPTRAPARGWRAGASAAADAQRAGAAATARSRAGLRLPGRAGDFLELTKPGITRLVVMTTAAGYYLGSVAGVEWGRFAHTLLATGLVAAGAGALNHLVERDVDACMNRTRNRPLPAGRLSPGDAFWFSLAVSLAGVAWMVLAVGAGTALIVALSLATYVWLYTPLKRRTSLNTLVGGIPGALPIVAGWYAATGELGAGGWALFGILFLWQIPHFLALAYIYRDDYRRGGLVMLPEADPSGHATGRQATLYALALLPVSLLPTLTGVTGGLYFFGAFALGLGFLAAAAGLAVRPENRAAWRLFIASVIYLPLLLVVMVADRLLA